jgi:hypothetical protein
MPISESNTLNLRPTVVNTAELLKQLKDLSTALKDEGQFKRALTVHIAMREIERLNGLPLS